MSTALAPILQYFFTEHLVSHKQVSPRTIAAYRDSFRLLLQFLKKKTGKQPFTLCVDDLDAPAIIDFLESLEEQRGNQVCSRNARLTAIRSFFHVVALRDPVSIALASRVLAIPRKRTDKRLVGYLTREEIDAVLTAPDQSTWIGRRGYALLLTMYNSGSRQILRTKKRALKRIAPANSSVQSRRCTSGLSRRALIFRVHPNETQGHDWIATANSDYSGTRNMWK